MLDPSIQSGRWCVEMALVIIGALLIPPVLAYVGVISLFVMFLAEIGILFVAAWGIDRNRAVGARDPFLDANRPDISMSLTNQDPPRPAEAIERPEDRPGRI
jgi:hypothetical protein